jgi:pimeloyl-ACP methyl ester carboxylesterase
MSDALVTILHEALPTGSDPCLHWIHYEPATADTGGDLARDMPPWRLTLLLVPGAGHSAAGFDLLARRLAGRFGIRCVALNPRGKGVGADVSSWSRPLDEVVTLDQVTDVLAVVEHLATSLYLHPARIALLGHSYGGAIARIAAQQAAASLAGLILLQSFMPLQLPRVVTAFVAGMLRRGHPLLALLPPIRFTALFTTKRRRRITLLGPNATVEDDARCAAQLCPESRRALMDTLALGRARSGPGAPARPHTVRALVFGGDWDRMVPLSAPRQSVDELRALRLPHLQWTSLRRAPHDAFLMERHVDEIAETIALFFGTLVASGRAAIGASEEARMRLAPDVEKTEAVAAVGENAS